MRMAKELANARGLLVERFESEPNYAEPLREKPARGRGVAMLRILWDRRMFLAHVAGIGLLLSTVLAFLLPKQYTSTIRLMPPDQASSSNLMMAALAGRASSGFASLAGDFLGMHTSGVLFIGMLESRTVQDDLINKFNLHAVYKHKLWEDTRTSLVANSAIAEDRKSGIITLTITDKSPQRAAAMAQEYVDELNRVVTDLNTSSAHRERIFLEGRLAQVKDDLESAERQFSEFASKNGAIDIKEQGRAMIEAAAGLEGELIATQTELQSLKQVYADNNVRVRATQAKIDELQRQLHKLGGTSTPSPAEQNTNESSMYPSIRQLPLLGVSYADLYRRTKVEETVFETLTQQFELAKVEEAKETPSVKVLDPPDIPEKKSSPHRLWIMLEGTLLSFSVCAVWILCGDQWERLDPQDPGKLFAQEIYGTVRAHLPLAGSNGRGVGKPIAMSAPSNCDEPNGKRE
jgi:capsule polysaccharide export protein KpsE/RkpR